MNWLRQLFCKHNWVRQEPYYMESNYSVTEDFYYKTYTCSKCGKTTEWVIGDEL